MNTVLLVDDEKANTTLLKMYLEMDGFSVLASPGVQHAKDILTADVKAVVVDYYLSSDTTGLMLINAIRNGETKALENVPIIVTSGDDRRETEVLGASANMFLLKPFAPTTLSSHLRNMIKSDS